MIFQATEKLQNAPSLVTTSKSLPGDVIIEESYSLSVLMYAAPALTLRCRQIEELNACWNGVFRRIFGYGRFESVGE